MGLAEGLDAKTISISDVKELDVFSRTVVIIRQMRCSWSFFLCCILRKGKLLVGSKEIRRSALLQRANTDNHCAWHSRIFHEHEEL